MLRRILHFLFAVRPAPVPPPVHRAAAPRAPRPERTSREALAEAEARMKRLSPEKAQLIRGARLVHRVKQDALAELDPREVERLRRLAAKAFGGGGRNE